MIWIIDNYDSFTYNLVEIFHHLCEPLRVIKNDEMSIEQIKDVQKNIKAFVISPGPGSPQNAGISHDIIHEFHTTKPILGVCLGHQVICDYFGARVINAERIMHGKVTTIFHDERGVFRDLSQAIPVNRYHSLIVQEHAFPSCLEVTAWSDYGERREIMAVRHKTYPIESVQFHPESILTPDGKKMIQNFIYFK